ncbi:hypothetical protein ACFL6P_00170 [Candidatus Latescibacterota bacterium]
MKKLTSLLIAVFIIVSTSSVMADIDAYLWGYDDSSQMYTDEAGPIAYINDTVHYRVWAEVSVDDSGYAYGKAVMDSLTQQVTVNSIGFLGTEGDQYNVFQAYVYVEIFSDFGLAEAYSSCTW